MWRNLNGTGKSFVEERERSLCQGRKGPQHAERERVGHRFLTFLKKASTGTCFPLLALTSRFSRIFREICQKVVRKVYVCQERVRQNRLQFLRPAAVHSDHAYARASASGGNRFTWISIIVIKHAASMNYLFVGTASAREG